MALLVLNPETIEACEVHDARWSVRPCESGSGEVYLWIESNEDTSRPALASLDLTTRGARRLGLALIDATRRRT